MKLIGLLIFITLSYLLFMLLNWYFKPEVQNTVFKQTIEEEKGSKFFAYPEVSTANDGVYKPVDTYIVKAGDSLNSIAIAHQTSSQLIIRANNIANQDIVSAQTTLLIPKYDALTTSNLIRFATGQRTTQSATINQELERYLTENKLIGSQISVTDQAQDKAKAEITINDQLRNFYLYHYEISDWQIYAMEVK